MKSNTWRWARLMSIGALSAMQLSLGAGPAMALNNPPPCTWCEPAEEPPPPPPPPPSPSCSYEQPAQVAVPDSGLAPSPLVKRATEKSFFTGSCSTACPTASFKSQGPLGCDCYFDTIPQLRVAGVGTTEMQRTRYAILSEPSKAKTRTLLVALAGQNGLSSGGSSNGGGPGNVTGQPNHWDASCNDLNCGQQPFAGASFVGRLLGTQDASITDSNTFTVSFLDHQYDWSSPYRAQIRQGLFNWLKDKVATAPLQQIIIAGHSRGACLALGLIKEFRADHAFDTVKILGATVDGTCMDGEQGTLQWGGDKPNPLVPWTALPGFHSVVDWYAWPSSFSTDNNQNVCIQNTVGGVPQAFIAGVHSFFLTNSKWRNTWINIPHATAGQCTENNRNKDCGSGGSYNVKTDVVDRLLRFIVNNRVQ